MQCAGARSHHVQGARLRHESGFLARAGCTQGLANRDTHLYIGAEGTLGIIRSRAEAVSLPEAQVTA